MSTTIFLIIFISITMFIVSINKSRTELNVEEVSLLRLKIDLEAFALNFVGNKNVKRQVSSDYKTKGDLQYRIDYYDINYIIYVYNPNNPLITYYMIFNNPRTDLTYDKMTILKDGYIEGVNHELES